MCNILKVYIGGIMKKYFILLFLFSALYVYAETVPEFKERVMRLGEYWETND